MWKVSAINYTDIELARSLAGATSGKDEVKMPPQVMYLSEHSPSRGVIFVVDMLDIPTFCSVHFVRHKVGVEHYVKSNRDDRGGTGVVDRNTPVRHKMFINAQGLIDMAKMRLCFKAHHETRAIMMDIVRAVSLCDETLAKCMVPKCVYRNGICGEPMPCGMLDYNMVHYFSYLKMFIDRGSMWSPYIKEWIERGRE